jgi:ribosome-associated protein
VGTGGEAKMRIQGGEVRVNGFQETRRGRKLKPGDRVELAGRTVVVTDSL